MNISSIVVQTLPKHINEVVESLKNCDVCDYHSIELTALRCPEIRLISLSGSAVSSSLDPLNNC